MASRYNRDDDYDELSSQTSSHTYTYLQDWTGTGQSSETVDCGHEGYVPPRLQGKTKAQVSALSDGVSGMKLTGTSKQSEKKMLYRCYLEAKIEGKAFSTGVALCGSEIFVAGGDCITVFRTDGGFERGIRCHELKNPWDLKIFDNLLYVTDIAEDKKVVLIMHKNGDFKSQIGLPGDEVGLTCTGLGLAIDEITKDIYVSSYNTSTVYKCPHGRDHFKPFITSGLSGPAYLCVDHNNEVVVSNAGSHSVAKYSIGGRRIWGYGEHGSGNGQLNRPAGICTDLFGNVYVADQYNNRIVQISPDGKFKSNVNIVEVLERPQGITFKDNKFIITADRFIENARERMMRLVTEPNCLYVAKCQFVDE